MVYKTSPTHPPNDRGVIYWERTKDPSHPEAYREVFRLAGILLPKKQPVRLEGWGGLDYGENLIVFVPDGSIQTGHPPDVLFVIGRYGRLCAFPTPLDIERLKMHIVTYEPVRSKNTHS